MIYSNVNRYYSIIILTNSKNCYISSIMNSNYLTLEQLEKALKRKKSSIYKWVLEGMPYATHPLHGRIYYLNDVMSWLDSKIVKNQDLIRHIAQKEQEADSIMTPKKQALEEYERVLAIYEGKVIKQGYLDHYRFTLEDSKKELELKNSQGLNLDELIQAERVELAWKGTKILDCRPVEDHKSGKH